MLVQTFRDWVCEVHNDAPDDPTPALLVSKLDDTRLKLVQHPTNLGGTATFNLIFRAVSEPYYSMLEDDNWWEPDFLSVMLESARKYPGISAIWSNMRVWEEVSDGRFTDTGSLVRPMLGDGRPRLVHWGQREQVSGAMHSQGAALISSAAGTEFGTPAVPMAAVEMFRERRFPHPMLFVQAPLANFSRTLQSGRSNDRGEWVMTQTMLAATFLKHAGYGALDFAELLERNRSQSPPATGALLLAALLEPQCRELLKHSRPEDWILLARGMTRRPRVLWRTLASRRTHREWWEFLDRHTYARFAEQKASQGNP